jgi:hypothetical protein
LGLFWFDFFGFRLIKPKPNYTDWFCQNFNRFFFTVQFFWLFFFWFSRFNRFFCSPLVKGNHLYDPVKTIKMCLVPNIVIPK